MKKYQKPKFEVADVFNQYGDNYLQSNPLPLDHLKVFYSLKACRTAVLGGHLNKCSSCEFTSNSYNSCKNRHCPKCQGMNQLKWIEDRNKDLLPVKYFHLVFTIPSELNHLCLTNRKVLYNILFKASSQTIKMLCKDEKHLGANPAILSVLHTWGQKLTEHPHIHMIVSAGGKTDDNKWKHSRKKFFIPVKVMSKVFRAKFLCGLKDALKDGEIIFVGKSKFLEGKNNFQKLINQMFKKAWVVYAKKPFKGAGGVLKYLGKYTHRIAISNHRILSVKNGMVRFLYKDYQDNSKQKHLTMNASEFIRRFLLHVLPSGFFKIRHYGIIASRVKKENLKVLRKNLKATSPIEIPPENWQEKLLRLTGFNVLNCPKCKKHTFESISPIKGALT